MSPFADFNLIALASGNLVANCFLGSGKHAAHAAARAEAGPARLGSQIADFLAATTAPEEKKFDRFSRTTANEKERAKQNYQYPKGNQKPKTNPGSLEHDKPP
jgi:hypothetical protein